MGYSPCRVRGRPNGALELSDGVYVWPEGFSRHLRELEVGPPEVFVRHVLARVDWLGETAYNENWWRSFVKP